MRIEALELLAYGHYEETILDLSQPEGGLTIVWGPNEAGKSTARRAMLAVLFGLERGDQDVYRYGRHGVRLGARLVSADGRRLAFVREGQSKVFDERRAPLDEGVIRSFCGEVDRQLCGRLLSIGHEELRTGSEALLEADGEIGRLVYGASLGAGSVAAVLRRLDERAGRLFQERGRAQRIPKALDGYRDRMREAKAARVRSRDWEQRRQAVEDARTELAEVRSAFERARARAARLEQIRSARPLLARRKSVVAKLSALGEVASPSWADQAAGALARYKEACAASQAATERRDRLAAEVARTDVPGGLLERAAGIDRLVEGIDRYRKDTEDLPKRRAELEAADEAVVEQLRLLGLARDDGRLVAEADLATIEGLARAHVGLMADGRTAREELARVAEQVAAARGRLAELPEVVEVAGIERALRVARPRLEAASELEIALAAQAAEHEDLRAAAGRLGLGGLELSAIEALAVPAAGELEAEQARRAALRLEQVRLGDERERLDKRLQLEQEEMARLGSTLPDPGRLASARRHRDAGWLVVRRVLEGGEPDASWPAGGRLVEAYERAVAGADEAADERYEHAAGMALLDEHRGRLGELEQELHGLAERERALDEADRHGRRRWTARWSAIGVAAGEPEAMLRWLGDERDLVERLGAWRSRAAQLKAAAAEVDRQAAALTAALADAGHAACSTSLDLLVEQAEEIVTGARKAGEERRDALVAMRLAEESEPARRSALARHEAEVVAWQEAWAAGVRPLELPTSVEPEAAAVAVAAHRSLVTARVRRQSLERRIEGIEADRRDYAAQVRAVAADLVTSGLLAEAPDGTPLEIVPALQRALSGGRAAEQRRDALVGQLEAASEAAECAADEVALATQALGSLWRDLEPDSSAGASPAEPDEGVDLAVRRAREAASLGEKLEELELDLLDQADGRPVDDLEADSAAAGDALAGEIAGANAEVDVLTKRLEEASTVVADAERALREVTGAARAADAEQDAQGELALAAELATEYAATALAAEVLRRTIREYGERHRGPILARASELFCQLTEGAFAELVADAEGDRQVLLARRAAGELCPPAALSDGALDQLYLALRLAGLEHQLAAMAEPLPVVLDDVLVHFDDARAAAAIRALGDLGRTTQAVLFTHHERIVEIAERELPAGRLAVVALAPRGSATAG